MIIIKYRFLKQKMYSLSFLSKSTILKVLACINTPFTKKGKMEKENTSEDGDINNLNIELKNSSTGGSDLVKNGLI